MSDNDKILGDANAKIQSLLKDAAEIAEAAMAAKNAAERCTLETLTSIGLLARVLADGVSQDDVVAIRNTLRRVVLPWETDNAKPPRHVRKNLAGEKVCVVDTHAGEDPHNPDTNGVTWEVTPRHTKIKPTPNGGIKVGKNCVYRSKQACDKALGFYGSDIVIIDEWKGEQE